MKEEKKAIVKTPENTVSTAVDYGADVGAGFENQTNSDISIPFLSVLQSNSPQITEREDARPGMLLNTVTEELFSGKIGRLFVPALTKHVYVEWKPRSAGGGMVAIHPVESEVAKKAVTGGTFGKYKVGDNDLVETFYMYGMLLNEDSTPDIMAVISFSSTKIGVYKRANTKIRMFQLPQPDGRKVTPPLFAHRLRITSVSEKNAKGDYFNFDIQPAVNGSIKESLLPPGHPALEAARDCKIAVESNTAKAAYETAEKPAAGNAGDPDWNA